MILFAGTSDSSSIGVFGSIAPGGGGATYSKVIATVQSLNAWGSGWKAEVVSPLRPAIQDFNAVDYVFSYGICYLHEMGIPEWDAGTVYYQDSYCQVAGIIYYSLQDNNLNQNPTTQASYWTAGLKGLSFMDLTTDQTAAGIKTFSSFPVTPSSAPTTDYQVANKKYVDDAKASVLTQVGLGSWIDKTSAYGAQQALTDGLVVCYGHGSVNGGDSQVNFYTDGASNPGTLRGRIYTNSNTTENYTTITCPVKKNDYWKIVQGASGGVISVYWIPIGS